MSKNKNIQETESTDYTEVVVHRNKLNMTTINFTKDGKIHSLRVYPGTNRITDEIIISCINDPKCNRVWMDFLKPSKFFRHGCHEIITGQVKKGTKQTTSFTSMDADTAKLVVSETYSIEQLKQMYSDEERHKSRKTILSAIMGQIDLQSKEDVGKH